MYARWSKKRMYAGWSEEKMYAKRIQGSCELAEGHHQRVYHLNVPEIEERREMMCARDS
jgi:hypothetical protein